MAKAWITTAEMANPADPDAPFAAEAASWILYKLTGEKYPGVSSATEVYLHDTVDIGSTCWLDYGAVTSAGVESGLQSIVRVPLGQRFGTRQLRTRGRPIRSVSSIRLGVSGTLLDPSAYAVVNGAYVIRRDRVSWDLFSGVEIDYTYGIEPPEAGKRAAVILANELVKLASGDPTCRLPERVTSVSRQGISMTIMDPNEFIKDDRVGIYEVDLFIRAANPFGARKPAKIFSPDLPRGERWR